jgi:ABC-type Fe3+/spermidine/putrescine transport system ATPase subunit
VNPSQPLKLSSNGAVSRAVRGGEGPLRPSAARDERSVAVQFVNVSKSFGSLVAVRDISLSLREGTLTSLLGPSGCGKTTLLRLIAGLEVVSAGEIEIKGRSVGRMPIHKRNIGLVFQNYALFPHKTVGDNIAFGLKHRGVDRVTAAEKVRRALDIVRLPGIEERYPNQLSGGQQQRVALARAVVFEPDVLLLDEPLSALDANLREEMRIEIKLIQKALGLTTILVTHDQQEALAMSDEVVVMNHGTVQQVSDPKTIYRFPHNRFVAGFLGQANVYSCKVVGKPTEGSGQWLLRLDNGIELKGVAGGGEFLPQTGDIVDLVIRGSDITVGVAENTSGSINGFAGVVVDASYLGDDVHYLIDAAGTNFRAVCRIKRWEASNADEMLPAGASIFVNVPAEACSIIRAGRSNTTGA